MSYSVYIDDRRCYEKFEFMTDAAESIDAFTLKSASVIRIHDEEFDIWYRVSRSESLNAIELTIEDSHGKLIKRPT